MIVIFFLICLQVYAMLQLFVFFVFFGPFTWKFLHIQINYLDGRYNLGCKLFIIKLMVQSVPVLPESACKAFKILPLII